MAKCVGRFLFYPIALLIDWLVTEHLTDKIVLHPELDILQTAKVKIKGYVADEARKFIDVDSIVIMLMKTRYQIALSVLNLWENWEIR